MPAPEQNANGVIEKTTQPVEHALRACDAYHREDLAVRLRQARRRLDSTDVHVVVVGEFKKGKFVAGDDIDDVVSTGDVGAGGIVAGGGAEGASTGVNSGAVGEGNTVGDGNTNFGENNDLDNLNFGSGVLDQSDNSVKDSEFDSSVGNSTTIDDIEVSDPGNTFENVDDSFVDDAKDIDVSTGDVDVDVTEEAAIL